MSKLRTGQGRTQTNIAPPTPIKIIMDRTDHQVTASSYDFLIPKILAPSNQHICQAT